MIIDCIADLHGYYPELEGGDLLIIAGDLTSRDKPNEYILFHEWIRKQKYKKVILIAGNHDNLIKNGFFSKSVKNNVTEEWLGFEYLCDSGTEFQGLKIWGSPWSLWFHGVNPHCKAFMDKERVLSKKFDLIPSDTDILITHTPPYGILDTNRDDLPCGSTSLRNIVLSRERMTNLKLHVFGHIHEWGGKTFKTNHTTFVNCSYVDENYEPVNKPIRIIL